MGYIINNNESIDPTTGLTGGSKLKNDFKTTDNSTGAMTRAESASMSNLVDIPTRTVFNGQEGSIYDEGIEYGEDIAQHRHEEQGFFGSLGSALVQTGTTLAGQTLQGIGYLTDIEQIGNVLTGRETEFNNFLAQAGTDLIEAGQDIAPIYQDPSKEGQVNLGDWTYWAANAPSIISTLSMMLPGMAVAGALGKIGAISKMGALAQWGIKGAAGTLTSRYIEASMEAAPLVKQFEGLIGQELSLDQVNEIKKNYGVDIPAIESNKLKSLVGKPLTMSQAQLIKDEYGIEVPFYRDSETGAMGFMLTDELANRAKKVSYKITPELAKEAGGRASANNFTHNVALVATDLPQFLVATMPFGGISKGITKAMAKTLGKEFIPVLAKKGAKTLFQGVTEGGEEGYQYITSEDAKNVELARMGLIEKSELSDRVAKYVTDGEFTTSAIFGALGAGVMMGGMKGINKLKAMKNGGQSEDELRLENAESWAPTLNAYTAALKEAETAGDTKAYERIHNDFMTSLEIKAAANQNSDALIDFIEAGKSGEAKDIEELGFDENTAKHLKENGDKIIEKLKATGKVFQQNLNETGGNRTQAEILTLADVKVDNYTDAARQSSLDVNKIINDDKNWVPANGQTNIPVPTRLKDATRLDEEATHWNNKLAENTVALTEAESKVGTGKESFVVNELKRKNELIKSNLDRVAKERESLNYIKEEHTADLNLFSLKQTVKNDVSNAVKEKTTNEYELADNLYASKFYRTEEGKSFLDKKRYEVFKNKVKEEVSNAKTPADVVSALEKTGDKPVDKIIKEEVTKKAKEAQQVIVDEEATDTNVDLPPAGSEASFNLLNNLGEQSPTEEEVIAGQAREESYPQDLEVDRALEAKILEDEKKIDTVKAVMKKVVGQQNTHSVGEDVAEFLKQYPQHNTLLNKDSLESVEEFNKLVNTEIIKYVAGNEESTAFVKDLHGFYKIKFDNEQQAKANAEATAIQTKPVSKSGKYEHKFTKIEGADTNFIAATMYTNKDVLGQDEMDRFEITPDDVVEIALHTGDQYAEGDSFARKFVLFVRKGNKIIVIGNLPAVKQGDTTSKIGVLRAKLDTYYKDKSNVGKNNTIDTKVKGTAHKMFVYMPNGNKFTSKVAGYVSDYSIDIKEVDGVDKVQRHSPNTKKLIQSKASSKKADATNSLLDFMKRAGGFALGFIKENSSINWGGTVVPNLKDDIKVGISNTDRLKLSNKLISDNGIEIVATYIKPHDVAKATERAGKLGVSYEEYAQTTYGEQRGFDKEEYGDTATLAAKEWVEEKYKEESNGSLFIGIPNPAAPWDTLIVRAFYKPMSELTGEPKKVLLERINKALRDNTGTIRMLEELEKVIFISTKDNALIKAKLSGLSVAEFKKVMAALQQDQLPENYVKEYGILKSILNNARIKVNKELFNKQAGEWTDNVIGDNSKPYNDAIADYIFFTIKPETPLNNVSIMVEENFTEQVKVENVTPVKPVDNAVQPELALTKVEESVVANKEILEESQKAVVESNKELELSKLSNRNLDYNDTGYARGSKSISRVLRNYFGMYSVKKPLSVIKNEILLEINKDKQALADKYGFNTYDEVVLYTKSKEYLSDLAIYKEKYKRVDGRVSWKDNREVLKITDDEVKAGDIEHQISQEINGAIKELDGIVFVAKDKDARSLSSMYVEVDKSKFDEINSKYGVKSKLNEEVVIEPIIEEKPSATASALLAMSEEEDAEDADEIEPKLYQSTETVAKDSAEELAWFKKYFPHISVNELEEIRDMVRNVTSGGHTAWAAYYNAAIWVRDNMPEGTVYHEAFHVIFNLALTEKEVNQLLAQAEGTTLEEKEEWLADKFKEILLGRKADKSTKGFMAKIFRKLKQFLNAIWTNKNSFNLHELANRVEQGRYTKLRTSNFNDPTLRLYKEISGWDYSKSKVATDSINKYIVTTLLPYLRETYPAMTDMTDAEVMTSYIQTKKDTYACQRDIRDMLKLKADTLTGSAKANLLDLVSKMFSQEGKPLPLVFASWEELNKNQGIIVKINSVENKSVSIEEYMEAIDDDTSKAEVYDVNFISKSSKNTAPSEVKNVLRYLKTKEKNEFGLPKYYGYDQTYNTLLKQLSGITTVDEMKEILTKNVKNYPQYKQLLNMIKKDASFGTSMFQAFNRPNMTFLYLYADKDGNVQVRDANKSGVSDSVYKGWAYGFNNTKSNFVKGKVSGANGNKKLAEFNAISKKLLKDDFSKEDIDDMSSLLNSIGIDISSDTLYSMRTNPTINISKLLTSNYNSLLSIFKAMDEAKNPFEGIGTEDDKKSIKVLAYDSLKKIAEMVKDNSPSMFETSHISVGKEKVYSQIVPQFISTLVHNLHDPKKVLDILDNYSKDPLFATGREITNEPFNIIRDFQVDLATNKPKVVFNNIILQKCLQAFIDNKYQYSQVPGAIDNNIEKEDKVRKQLNEIVNIAVLEGKNIYNSRKEYSKYEDNDLKFSRMSSFWNSQNKTKSVLVMPPLSDSPNMLVITVDRLSKEDATTAIINIATGEYNRIQNLAKNDAVNPIKNYDDDASLKSTKTGYVVATMFNGFEGDPSKNVEAAKEVINEYFAKEAKDYANKLAKYKLVVMNGAQINNKESKLGKDLLNYMDNKDGVLRYVEDMLMNTMVSVGGMCLLSIGDPAFYKSKDGSSVIDYIKRAKEIFSPKSVPDTSAAYEVHETNGKYRETVNAGTQYTSIYVKDVEIVAPSINGITEFFQSQVDSGNITQEEMNENIENWSNVNHTDAQAFITPSFYRRTMVAHKLWTDTMQRAYDKLIEGKGTGADIITLQPIKPFMFDQRLDASRNLMIPNQHKNSEFILFPQLVNGETKLKALYDYMKLNNVDIANFNSAVKVGESGAIGFDELVVDKKTPLHHIINMEHRGIQQATPEHHIGSTGPVSTQLQVNAIANLTDKDKDGNDVIYTINGRPFTHSQLQNHYIDLIEASVIEAYDKVEDEFLTDGKLDWVKVSSILKLAAEGEQLPQDFVAAISYNQNTGKINLPPFDPLFGTKMESIFHSMARNKITKQKINQASLIQLSSVGLNNDLKLVFKSQEDRTNYEKDLVESENITIFAELSDEYRIPLEAKGYNEELWRELTKEEQEHAKKCATV